MMAPDITAFGDGDHDAGATGLTVDGAGFGAFPGSLWMYANANRTGAADELTIGGGNDLQLTGVEIPASPNNSDGTVYLFYQREDLAWSQGFQFTLGGAAVASAELSGTSVGAATTEQNWIDGGLTTISTLTDEIWAAAGATFDAQRQNILDGFTSSRQEAGGFEAQVRDNEAVTSVVRTSDTVVTITWSAAASYDISATEIVSLEIPASALAGDSAIQATPAMQINADAAANARTLERSLTRAMERSLERTLAA